MSIAHLMTLTGCEYLPQFNKTITIGNTWQCDAENLPICGNPFEEAVSRRIFTWKLDACGLKYPDGAGYRIGGDTRINYLVMQVHYKNKLPDGVFDDYSTFELLITDQK